MPLGNREGAGKMNREPGNLPVGVSTASLRKKGGYCLVVKEPDIPVRKRVILILGYMQERRKGNEQEVKSHIFYFGYFIGYSFFGRMH